MSSEDLDLFSIVPSCKAATFTAQTTYGETPPITITNAISAQDTTTHFPISQENGFLDLHQMLMSFINPTVTTSTTISTTTGNAINLNPNSTFSDLTGWSGQKQMQQGRHHLLPVLTTCTSIGASTPGLNISHQHQFQQHQPQVSQTSSMALPANVPQTSYVAQPNIQPQVLQTSSVALPNTQNRAPKPRRRKTQPKKKVRHVTPDHITADMWGWRKYGQKPIKGSPHPRNYYKCSNPKACAARKLVERSKTDPSMFIVTYIGDHDHDKPLSRNVLCGTTRVKAFEAHSPDTSRAKPPTNVGSVSSPMSVSDLMENDDNIFINRETEGLDIEKEIESVLDDDILIPNLFAMSNITEMGYLCFDGSAKHVGGPGPNSAPGLI